MIVARTIKGKGISFLEDKEGWHGKALNADQWKEALKELPDVDHELRGDIMMPEEKKPPLIPSGTADNISYTIGHKVATRKAYGSALKRLANKYPSLVSLDGEVSNSTMSEAFAAEKPHRFFEMFIAEQNMVEVALGMSLQGKLPFVSTFAAFFSRAFDQIRISQYSRANIKFVGSHAGVSIGEDGPSQMGLEDIALFRSIHGSTVLQPCDAVSIERLVETAMTCDGIVYLRTLRQGTPVIYCNDEPFPIGSSKVLRKSHHDKITLVASGTTVHEALRAYEQLEREGIFARVIDAYSIKPIDVATLMESADATGAIITIEDHYPAGGLGEAVLSALAEHPVPVTIMAVRKIPMSGSPEEQRDFAEISASAIVKTVTNLLVVSQARATANKNLQQTSS